MENVKVVRFYKGDLAELPSVISETGAPTAVRGFGNSLDGPVFSENSTPTLFIRYCSRLSREVLKLQSRIFRPQKTSNNLGDCVVLSCASQ
jgi:hypothetical protein